jgi:DNA-binding NtrC family response regulator
MLEIPLPINARWGKWRGIHSPRASSMNTASKRILLIDHDDSRRDSRVKVLHSQGYDVDVRKDHVDAESLDHEGSFDLIILALHKHPEDAASYSDHISRVNPDLPILLLTDYGVYVPRGTLSESLKAGSPLELTNRVATMLAGSSHIREVSKSSSTRSEESANPQRDT